MGRPLYTPDLANRSLPLVRAIARDLRETALEMEATWGELQTAEAKETSRDALSERVRDIQERFAALIGARDPRRRAQGPVPGPARLPRSPRWPRSVLVLAAR